MSQSRKNAKKMNFVSENAKKRAVWVSAASVPIWEGQHCAAPLSCSEDVPIDLGIISARIK